jgi:outer membrane protein
MIVSRAAAAVALGLVGVALLVGPSVGQQDGVVKRTNSQTQQTAQANLPVAALIGTCDQALVLKSYEKAKALQEEFTAIVTAKQGEMMKLQNEGQRLMETLEKINPGTEEFRKRQDQITELKARAEAKRESAQRELSLRESEMLLTMHKELQTMIYRVAKARNLTYVLQIQNAPPVATNPNSVYSAMAHTVLYADRSNDITEAVVYWLNQEYRKSREKEAGGAPANPGTPKAAANPAPNATR